jgi:hypothetical protein
MLARAALASRVVRFAGTRIAQCQEVPLKGDMRPTATMSNELAKLIYDEYHSGEATQVELAETYGLKLQTVRSLCQGRTWTSVTGAVKENLGARQQSTDYSG